MIQYKSGTDNLVANALSRVQGSEILLLALSTRQSDLLALIEHSWQTNPALQRIIQQKQQNPNAFPKYQLLNGQLRRNGKLVMGANTNLRAKLLYWVHTSPTGGHLGRDATLKRLKHLFYCKGMNKAVQQFIRLCTTCQTYKYDTNASPSLLQPLPIPEEVWIDISMDFIKGATQVSGQGSYLGCC